MYDLFQWKRVDNYKGLSTNEIIHDMRTGISGPLFEERLILSPATILEGGAKGPWGIETSMRQVVHRMVAFWVASLEDEGMIQGEEQKQILYDELVYLLLSQSFAPNSPQWFNTGLKHAYDIAGEPSGLYYYDLEKKEVVESKDQYTRTQASACFIISIEDKLMGDKSISEQYVTETKLFKGGSGTGTNFSTLRAEGERLSGGGV